MAYFICKEVCTVCLTLRDISHGLVTAPRSHAVIIMDLRTHLFYVVFIKLETLHKEILIRLILRRQIQSC